MTAPPVVLPDDIARLRDAGALFAVNHSGGKDSQAMLIALRAIVPVAQLHIFHAHLGRVEWPGTLEHIAATSGGVGMTVVAPPRDLLAMVRRRGRWPSPRYRQCTSDLKRGPLDTAIRRHLKAHPHLGGRVVSCLGLRAEESRDRARRATVLRHPRENVAGRSWLQWLPIHGWTTGDVFGAIAAAGEQPHWVYGEGLTRCSCSFCIMASLADLRRAAALRPDLLAEYDAVERETGHTLRAPGKDGRPRRLIEILGD